MPAASTGSPYDALHGAPGRFWNPWRRHDPGLAQVVRWWLSPSAFDKRRPPVVPRVDNDGASLAGVAARPEITWVGHSTFALHDGAEVVLTDPHFGPRALLPKRHSPPGVPLEAVPADAFVVLSHNHYDHLDLHTLRRLPATVHLFVPWGQGEWLRRRVDQPVTELDWWASARHRGWTLTALPAQHWSNRRSQRRNGALWCSWLLDSGRHRTYFAGDSGYFGGFAEIGRRFPGIDLALLPIGAYEPRWFMRYQHLNPAEAYRAFGDLGARHMIGMHWGTFDLTDEPIDLAPRALAEAVVEAGGDPERVHTLAIGERWRLPATATTGGNPRPGPSTSST